MKKLKALEILYVAEKLIANQTDIDADFIREAIVELENLSIDDFHICNECCFDFATCKGKDQKFSDAVLKCNEYKKMEL